MAETQDEHQAAKDATSPLNMCFDISAADSGIEQLLSSTLYPGVDLGYDLTQAIPPDDMSLASFQRQAQRQAVRFETIRSDSSSSSQTYEPRSSISNLPRAPTSGRAAGSKRKIQGQEEKSPSERRRRQIREAQRAYRQRKNSQAAFLEERVKKLEGAIENMTGTVLSFSEELISSNALSHKSELVGHLRNALSTCLTLIRETNDAEEQDTEPETPSDVVARCTTLAPSLPPYVPLPPSLGSVLGASLPHVERITGVTAATFTDMLTVAIIYQGYLSLADPTFTTARLHHHFGLTLQLMDHSRLLSYFFALFRSKLNRESSDDVKGSVPFLRIGGAGTHYLSAGAQTGANMPNSVDLPPNAPVPQQSWADVMADGQPRYFSAGRWTVGMDSANVPASFRDRYEGEWFDMRDLRQYLVEKNVSLHMKPRNGYNGDVNVGLLMQGLIANAICLGQSAGFRRQDVELAIRGAQA